MADLDNLDDVPVSKSPTDGFVDFQDEFPLRQYAGKQSTNLEARGIEENKIPYGGGDKGIDLELLDQTSAEYPFNQVRRTISGHVTEFDDTPGRERILIKHKSGTGLEFQPDGTILLYSSKNTVRVTAGDEKIIIEGDGDIAYHGNLKLRVDGNFDLDVGGDFNVTVAGDKLEDVKGGIRQDVNGNVQSLINGNVSTQITQNETRLVHGNQEYYVKGNKSNLVQGVLENLSKDVMRMTSESQAVMSSPDINIGANDLSVFGAVGTIGGDQIVYYGTTAHIDRVNSTSMHASNSVHASVGMEAPTFNGNLAGNANTAGTAGTAALGASAGSSQTAVTLTPATNVDTTEFTTSLATDYLANDEHAVREVLIDPGALLYNQINRDADYGGVSDRTLTTAEVRSKLRDPLNQQNETFIGAILAEGLMHHSFSNAAPNDVDRIEGREATVRRAQSKKILGKNPGGETKRFKGSVRDGQRLVAINSKYKPDGKFITSRTELAQGIVVGRFLGGSGDAVTFDHVIDNSQRTRIARNLLLNANANKAIMVDNDIYSEHRLVVAEGIYRKYVNEGMTTLGVNDLKSRGRCVVYELHDRTGNIDPKKTFDLASWWKDSLQFEKMILSYDTFNPQGGTLTAQIILIMPELGRDYKATFDNSIETRFNNFVQSTNEIIECL